MRLIPTVLCGGAGSRLWPVSRELHPKPFIRLADGQSLLHKAFLRGATLPGAADLVLDTPRSLFYTPPAARGSVVPAAMPATFVLEPFGRNTAAAIAAAALRVARTHGPEALMLVLPADHLVADTRAFEEAVGRAARLAEEGRLVTFGIRPDAPHTGYGYIEAEGEAVLRFVEKPSAEAAREYVGSGRFLWNSGMFCVAAGTVVEEMRAHCPEVLAAVEGCLAHAGQSSGEGRTQLELPAADFERVPDISIDYALMEKSRRVSVVACDIGWSDIGSWSAVGDLTHPDANRNQVEGKAFLHDVTGCYIRGAARVIGAVGVANLLIIDTADALLVADKARAQDVKLLYDQLKAEGHEAYKLHRTVHRPWGTYTVLEEGPGFKIKRIEVKPGASLSLQVHRHRSEHWVVVSGTATVGDGERELLVRTNESTYIAAGCKHRLGNATSEPLVMIEVQSGAYLGEDDIVRFDDRYGRVAALTR